MQLRVVEDGVLDLLDDATQVYATNDFALDDGSTERTVKRVKESKDLSATPVVGP